MTREQYLRITEPLRNSPKKAYCIRRMNSILAGIVSLSYPCYLSILFIEKDPVLTRAVFVPLVSFLLLTFIRWAINAPRPYEKFGVPPVISKETKGKAFPSRHVFSVFVIAAVIYVSYPAAGIMLGIIGIGIAFLRVAGGVHEPKDVIAGAAAGILSGTIGYYLL